MDRLPVESKSPTGKWLLFGTCLLLCSSVLLTRLISPGKPSFQAKSQETAEYFTGKYSLYHQAYIAWHHDHQFEKSRELYQKLFATGEGKQYMHLSYADILAENGKKEEALREYRLGYTGMLGASGLDTCQPLAMARYSVICRRSGRIQEADWAEEQIVLAAGQRYSLYPHVTSTQLPKIPVHAMSEIARGLELRKRGEQAKAYCVFREVAQKNPHLELAQHCLQLSLDEVSKSKPRMQAVKTHLMLPVSEVAIESTKK